MRVYRSRYTDEDGNRRETSAWYIDFKDHTGQRRRMAAFENKKASEEFARRVEQLVECLVAGRRPDTDMSRWLESVPPALRERLAEMGLLDQATVAANKPLVAHVEDWRQSLLAKGTGKKRARQVSRRTEKLLEQSGIKLWADITPSKIEHALAEMRTDREINGKLQRGISAQTSNTICKRSSSSAGGWCRRGAPCGLPSHTSRD